METVVFDCDELKKDYCIRNNATRITFISVFSMALMILEIICLAFLISFNTINIVNFNFDLFTIFATCLTVNILLIMLTYRYFFYSLNTSFISNRFYEVLEYNPYTGDMHYSFNPCGFFRYISNTTITYQFNLRDVELYQDFRSNVIVLGEFTKIKNHRRYLVRKLMLGNYFQPEIYSFMSEQQNYLV